MGPSLILLLILASSAASRKSYYRRAAEKFTSTHSAVVSPKFSSAPSVVVAPKFSSTPSAVVVPKFSSAPSVVVAPKFSSIPSAVVVPKFSSTPSSVVAPKPPRPPRTQVENLFFDGIEYVVDLANNFDTAYLDPIMFPGLAEYYNNAPETLNPTLDPSDGKRAPRFFAMPISEDPDDTLVPPFTDSDPILLYPLVNKNTDKKAAKLP